MKPSIKNSVAIFYPNGFIDGDNASSIITGIDETEILNKKPQAIFISLKKVIFFNKKGMAYLADRMSFLKDECAAFVGFCDYNEKKYDFILSLFSHDISFSLIQSEEMLYMFCGTKKIEKKEVIIYTKNSAQKNQLAMALIERKHEVFIAKDKEDFLSKRKNFDNVVENSYIGSIEKKVSVFIKNNIIIYTLKGFIDSDFAENFDKKYHKNAIKVGFRIFCFNADDVSSVNIHGANFLAKLSIEGAEYGVSVAICGLKAGKITKILMNDMEDSGIMLYADLKSFFEDEVAVHQANLEVLKNVKKTNINKKIISILPEIIDSVVHTMEVLSDKTAQKQSVKIRELNDVKEIDCLTSIVGVYGDINCVIILIMQSEIAKKVCKILMPEEYSPEDLSDAYSEFSNVIGGKVIQKLKSRHINIEITMPRIFYKISEVMKLKNGYSGVQANFKIENQDMILFLSK
ncbi:MAG: chemotaxis protein CheX [Epsilonproteobacteria bacterium]|nr:chemotaxis protein CheX [Campylobacterota bacterium]